MIASHRFSYQYLVSIQPDLFAQQSVFPSRSEELPKIIGKCLNLSRSGLAVLASNDQPFQVNDEVLLRIQFGESFLDSESLELAAKIVWRNKRMLGICFGENQIAKNRTLYENLIDGFEALTIFRPILTEE